MFCSLPWRIIEIIIIRKKAYKIGGNSDIIDANNTVENLASLLALLEGVVVVDDVVVGCGMEKRQSRTDDG